MKITAAAATARQPSDPWDATRAVPADGMALAYLVAIFVATALIAILVAVFVHHPGTAEPRHVRFVIGTTTLEVPGTWLRPDVSRTGGQTDRLDLVIPWPEEPLEGEAAGNHALQTAAIERVVLVSLVPADSALAPPDRPTRLYSRFLTADVWPNPGGLILRRFRPGTPYEDEELYLSPPDGRAFAARCPRSLAVAPIREGCVAEIRVGGLDAQLRFAPARLVAWERLAEGARRAIAGMSVAAD